MSAKSQSKHVVSTLTALYKRGVATTAAELGLTPVEASRLREAGLVRNVGFRQTGKRGRPAVEYRLTDKARKRVKRALASA